MHRVPMTVVLLLLVSSSAAAQSLHDELSQLFIFGDGQDPLFLGGTGDPNNPESVRIHGNHFVPAAVASNGTVISFLTNSIGSNVANVPVSATSGGSTFSFEGGVPVRTSTSAGPVFGERAQTLGRGRVLAGLSRTGVSFKTIRGVDLDRLRFTFTHANSDFEGCDSIAGGDCSLLGVPLLENETIDLDLALDVRLTVTTFLLTYGLTDRIDVGVVLPLVSTTAGRHEPGADQPVRSPTRGAFLRRYARRSDPHGHAVRARLGDRTGRRGRAREGQSPARRAAGRGRAGRRALPDRQRPRPPGLRRLRRPRARDSVGPLRGLLAPRQRRLPLPRRGSSRPTPCSARSASTTCWRPGPHWPSTSSPSSRWATARSRCRRRS